MGVAVEPKTWLSYVVRLTKGDAVDKLVTAVEANRQFSRILREVREGETYVVTAHGRPVARITSFTDVQLDREAAKRRLLEHLDAQEAVEIGPWTRDELHER